MNVAIYAPGKRLERSYGVSDIDTGAAIDRDDTVRIASISKSFTAVAVLRLIDKKRLRLTDKLDEYVEGVPNGDQINIRELLAMTAGIHDFTRDDQFNAAFSADPLYPGWKPTDVLPILEAHGPDFPPGQEVSYSDSNYILLGLIIEEVTGRPVRQVINRLARIAGSSRQGFRPQRRFRSRSPVAIAPATTAPARCRTTPRSTPTSPGPQETCSRRSPT